jgi:hypothetical protein
MIYAEYLYVFMLYHSFHLSSDFINELGPCTGKDPKTLIREIGEMKEKIRIRISGKLEKKLQVLGIEYYLLVRNQHRFGDLYIEQYNCSQKEYNTSRKKRRQAIQTIKDTRFFPTWVQIEESFKDDTFWG